MINSGADIIDIGGESTRPGSHIVSPKKEWKRVAKVIKNFIYIILEIQYLNILFGMDYLKHGKMIRDGFGKNFVKNQIIYLILEQTQECIV